MQSAKGYSDNSNQDIQATGNRSGGFHAKSGQKDKSSAQDAGQSATCIQGVKQSRLSADPAIRREPFHHQRQRRSHHGCRNDQRDGRYQNAKGVITPRRAIEIRAVNVLVLWGKQVQKTREEQSIQPDADFDRAVPNEGPPEPVRKARGDRSSQAEPSHEYAQSERGGIDVAAEEQCQAAHPDDFVDQRCKARQEEYDAHERSQQPHAYESRRIWELICSARGAGVQSSLRRGPPRPARARKCAPSLPRCGRGPWPVTARVTIYSSCFERLRCLGSPNGPCGRVKLR